MTDLTYDAVRDALSRVYYSASVTRSGDVITAQAEAIMDLIEGLAQQSAAETEPYATCEVAHGEALLGRAESPEELRARAYELAIKSEMGHGQPDLHVFAAEIESNIVNGFGKKTEVINVKLKINAPSDLDDIILRQFGRDEYRREGWNDCKSVLIRDLNKRLRDHVSGDILAGFKPVQYEKVRSFIASYVFDPDMP